MLKELKTLKIKINENELSAKILENQDDSNIEVVANFKSISGDKRELELELCIIKKDN